MGLCSVAIMLDWDCKSKIILNQSIIAELLKDGPKCDHKKIAAKIAKLPLDQIEHIYLPILKNKHWILAVVDSLNEIVELYDSLFVVVEGQHPHKDLWDNLAANLREASCIAR
uniref:Uncharacterized protein n=2 Tax=Avena sativa TaxID=4498 RepID=A0ACD5YEN3_AVESA